MNVMQNWNIVSGSATELIDKEVRLLINKHFSKYT